MYRRSLIVLPLVVILLTIASASAQGNTEVYSIQFLADGDGGLLVKHDPFPDAAVQFLIMKDGAPVQTPWPSEKLRLLEDDREIPLADLKYTTDKQPLDVTVVYHFMEYSQVENDGPHINTLEQIEAVFKDDIRLRSLCLTMVSDVEQKPCKAIGNNEQLIHAFNTRTDFTKRVVVDSIRRVNYQVIWDSILADRVTGRPHQVLWVLDDDILGYGQKFNDLLPVDESQLARLDEAGVSLIFMDLTPNDDLQQDDAWKNLLGSFEIHHLMRVGMNHLQDGSCEIWDCMRNVMEAQRPLIHTLSYKSPLFVDSGPHSLRVQLLSLADGGDNGRTIASQQRVDFVISPPYQVEETKLKPGVRIFSLLFNGMALVVLISVLVLIKRPQDTDL